jgi:hypothetical protein
VGLSYIGPFFFFFTFLRPLAPLRGLAVSGTGPLAGAGPFLYWLSVVMPLGVFPC